MSKSMDGVSYVEAKPAVEGLSIAQNRDSKAEPMRQLSAQGDIGRVKGDIPATVYIRYVKACGVLAAIATLSISIIAQFMDVSKDIVLAFWADNSPARPSVYLPWYSGVCALVVMMNCLRFFAMCWLGLRGSKTLHESLLLKVMGAPISFFYVTEPGRITSRFSSDFNSIDLVIPPILASFVDALFTMVASVGMVVGTTPTCLLFVIPIALAYYRIQLGYRISAKELKRLDSATKSPIYTHFQETLDGLASVQAYGIERRMREKNFELIDANTRARLSLDATNRWLGIRLDLLGTLIVLFAALVAVITGKSSPGMAGLALSYALSITHALSFGVRSSAALENNFNSVERVDEFISLEQEEDHQQYDDALPSNWPSVGLEVRDVFARHRPDLPSVLNGVTLSVRCGERVGICGRTGSGKSSLALALVRMLDCFQGSITVDGRDVKEIPLSHLRSGVTILSQDAYIFSGTVRDVMDPFGQVSDARLWEIAEYIGLKNTLEDFPEGLHTTVSVRGGNWSAGQRQLMCISRAIVNNTGVVIFDEATANVDLQTDALIRQLIQTQLREAAVIVIAHRLEDIISCHRAVVMDAGHIVEDGEPSQLLLDEDSQLLRFVRELGPDLEEQLRQECGCYKK